MISASAAALALLVLSGCAIVPSISVAPERISGLLPAGKNLYFFVDAAAQRGLLSDLLSRLGLSTAGSRYILENADVVYAALGGRGADGRMDVQALVVGAFSRGLIDFGLGADAGWERERHSLDGWDLELWRGEKEGLRLFVPNDGLLVLFTRSDDVLAALRDEAFPDPQRPARAAALPQPVVESFAEHALVLYVPVADRVLRARSAEGFPVTRALFFLNPREGGTVYELSGLLAVTPGRDARILGVLIRLGLAGWLSDLGVKDMRAVQRELVVETSHEGASFRGLVFTSEEIALVIQTMISAAGDT